MDEYQFFVDKNGREVKRKRRIVNLDYAITIKVNRKDFEIFKQKTVKNYGKIIREFMNNYNGE